MRIGIPVTVTAMLLAGLYAASASAASATGSLASSARVVANCNITAGNLSFSNYDPLAATATSATSVIMVACTKGTTGANLGLDNGANHSHATNGQQRAMASGMNFLSYDLWQDASHTIFWGNTPGSNTVPVPTPSSANPQSFTVYGLIPAHLNVPAANNYVDTVTATVNF